MAYYIHILRQTYDGEPFPEGDVVIGPFEGIGGKARAIEHMNNSTDVEDWCYGEAKAKRYIVDDVYVKKTPRPVPAHGINAPVFYEDNDAQGVYIG